MTLQVFSYPIGYFRILQKEKNRVEAGRTSSLVQTKKNANLFSQSRLCSFVFAQFESGLLKVLHVWSYSRSV